MCGCLYCNGEGPYYEDGVLIHYCEHCHEEYLEDGMGCPGCAAHEAHVDRWKESRGGKTE
jgi:hypothetical protein